MKVLLIGDLHYRKDNLDIMTKLSQEILTVIDDRKPDMVIVLGDTEDTHERLYLKAHTDAVKFFNDIAKRCPLVVLIGNHDRQNNSDFLTDIHPYIGLKSHPNMTVVDTTIWDRKNTNFIYVPYVAPGRFNEALSKVEYYPFKNGIVNVDGEQPTFIFCHQEFQGCLMGSQTSTQGDVWSAHLPQIFSGHIHEYQVLPKIVYVGTPYQSNYGESPDKALLMLYIDEESVPKTKFRAERIRLTSVPSKVTVHLTMEELSNFAVKIPPNCMVKAIIHLDATDLPLLKASPHYQALKSMVDKVTEKIESNRENLAQKLVNDLKQKGSLAPNKKMYTLEEVVNSMLHDDPYTLNIFKTEIVV